MVESELGDGPVLDPDSSVSEGLKLQRGPDRASSPAGAEPPDRYAIEPRSDPGLYLRITEHGGKRLRRPGPLEHTGRITMPESLSTGSQVLLWPECHSDIDLGRARADDPVMATRKRATGQTEFQDRLRWAWYALPRDEHGRPPTHAEIERAGELNAGEFSKLLHGRRRPDRAGYAVVAGLSRALQVSPEWLFGGRGHGPARASDTPRTASSPRLRLVRESEPPESGDPIPARGMAVLLARFDGLPEEAIAEIQGEQWVDSGQSAVEWLDLIRFRARELAWREKK